MKHLINLIYCLLFKEDFIFPYFNKYCIKGDTIIINNQKMYILYTKDNVCYLIQKRKLLVF